MPLVINFARPQDPGPARIIERVRSSASRKKAAVRGWCERRRRRSIKSAVEKVRQHQHPTKERHTEGRTDDSEESQRKSQNTELFELPSFENPSFTSLSNMGNQSEMSSAAPYFPGQVSMSSTISAAFPDGGDVRPLLHVSIPPSSTAARADAPPLGGRYVESPDDFAQLQSNLQGRVELECNAVTQPDEVGVESRVRPRSFNVLPLQEYHLRPYLVTSASATVQANPPPYQTLNSAEEGNSVEDNSTGNSRAFYWKPERGASEDTYIPPELRAGCVAGARPAGGAAHDGVLMNVGRSQVNPDAARYSWPFVNSRGEISLNSHPSDWAQFAHEARKRQEPQLPTMNFSGELFSEDFQSTLRDMEAQQSKMEDFQERAWMSPTLPLAEAAYELEATLPLKAQAVQIISRARSILVKARKKSSIVSARPRTPGTTVGPRVSFLEYNWPRFANYEYSDPADEHSRKYRERRRELRKSRAQQEKDARKAKENLAWS